MGSEPVQSFAELMRGALRILVFTGAGISTGSGIPDYRGPNGVWKTHAPVFYRDFMAAEELARAFETAFRADLVVALGSTLSVTPAANVPLEAASVRKKPW
jgi:NAD-dependent SIR2 family protein deacetylase